MPLQILLLGAPKIASDDLPPQRLKTLRRRERAALFLLAAHDKPLFRERLLEMLWGEDASPRTASNSLSSTLSRIGKVLPAGIFQRHNGTYSLASHPALYIDYRIFTEIAQNELIAAQRIPADIPLPPHIADKLTLAASLWRGPFLEGFSPPGNSVAFDNWLIATASRLEMHYLALLRRLAHHHLLTQNHAEAFRLSKISLEISPDQPEVLLLALRALRGQGLTTEIHTFLQKQRLLMRETSGQDYDPHTLQLAERCTRRPKSTPPRSPWHPHPTLKAPFIGRSELLTELQQRARAGGAFLLLGESGQGKTRLLQTFAHQMEETHRLLTVTCHAAERSLPFAPLVEAIRRNVYPDEWDKVAQAWWPYLLHLFPEALQYLPPVSISLPPAPLQHQLMEAIRQVLLAISEDTPLLLCVDDAQWSDAATADTLTYLLEREPFLPATYHTRTGFLLIAARGEALHSSPLGEHMLPLLHEQRLPSATLTGLSKQETAALAQTMLGRALAPEETENLWRASLAGTPLYLLEILRYQIESRHADKPVRQWPLSQHVVPLLEQRLRYLTDDARLVLEYIALQDAQASWQTLARATGLPQERLTHALEMLEETRWLDVQETEGRLVYTLVHNKLKEVITNAISRPRRQHIHKQLAEARIVVWGKNANSQAALIAHHYEEAGEPLKAFQWWIRAAHYALSLGIAHQANDAFRSAAQRIVLTPETFSDETIWRVYAEWMLLAADTVNIATLDNILRTLQELAETRRSALLQSSLLNAQAHLYRITNRYADAEVLTRQALQWLEQAPGADLPRLEIHTHHALIAAMQGHVTEATEHIVQAIAITQQTRDPLASLFAGNIYYQRALISVLGARPDIALADANTALETFQKGRRVFGIADALSVRSLAYFMTGEIEKALADCREARERAKQSQKTRMLTYIHVYCAMPLLAQGRLIEAWEATSRALALHEEYENPPGRAMALTIRGDIFAFLEDWENALAHYRASLENSSGFVLAENALFRLALALAHTGEAEEAHRLFAETSKQANTDRLPPLLTAVEADILNAEGHYRQAIARAAEALHAAATLHRPEVAIGAHIEQAIGYLGLGNRQAAQAAARRALALSAQIGYQPFHRWSLEWLKVAGGLSPQEKDALQAHFARLRTWQAHPSLGASIRCLLKKHGVLSEGKTG